MENERQIIYDFLGRCEDFATGDIESGYKNVYRPAWNPYPMQFWFNPPFNSEGISDPTISNALFLTKDGKVLIEDVYTDILYSLDDCLGDTVANFILAIRENRF